jgi:hydroxyacylglutathione hydrolase
LQLTKDDVAALPAALRKFNGFYTDSAPFVMENGLRILIVVAAAAVLVLALLGILIYRFIRRRRNRAAKRRQKLLNA